MSIFGTILHKIFGAASAAPNTAPPSSTPASAPPAGPGADPAAPTGPAPAQVDVEAVLTAMAAKNSQRLNWQTSIVDLMKLLDLDSSLDQRKLLADELGYSGDANDSAGMNVWLHKQVMTQLAQNGGIVPASLKV